jgi:hypothetical protein
MTNVRFGSLADMLFRAEIQKFPLLCKSGHPPKPQRQRFLNRPGASSV